MKINRIGLTHLIGKDRKTMKKGIPEMIQCSFQDSLSAWFPEEIDCITKIRGSIFPSEVIHNAISLRAGQLQKNLCEGPFD